MIDQNLKIQVLKTLKAKIQAETNFSVKSVIIDFKESGEIEMTAKSDNGEKHKDLISGKDKFILTTMFLSKIKSWIKKSFKDENRKLQQNIWVILEIDLTSNLINLYSENILSNGEHKYKNLTF